MRKGLSPIIAVILILLIAIGLTVLVMIILPRFTFKLLPETFFNESYMRSRACLSIEDVKGLFGFFTIKNCGKIDLTDFKFFLNGKFISSLNIEKLEPSQFISFYDMPIPGGRHEIYITADYAESPPYKLDVPFWECIGGEPVLDDSWYVSKNISCICSYNSVIPVSGDLYVIENGNLSLYNCILRLAGRDIYIRDNGFFNFTRSRATAPGWGAANFEDNSIIYLINSTFDGYPFPRLRDETNLTAINSYLATPEIVSSIPHRLSISDISGYCPLLDTPITKYIKADDSDFTINFTNVSFNRVNFQIRDDSNTTLNNATFGDLRIYSEYPHNLTISNFGCDYCNRFDTYFKSEDSNFEFNGTNFFAGWTIFYPHGGSNNTIIDGCFNSINIDDGHDSTNTFINFTSRGGWWDLDGRNYTMNLINSRLYDAGIAFDDCGSGCIPWTVWNFSNTTITDRQFNFNYGNITFFGNVSFIGSTDVGYFGVPADVNVTRYYPTIIKDSGNYPFPTIERARINITDINNQSVWEGSVGGGSLGTYYIEDPKIKFNRTNYGSGNFNMTVSQICENKTDIHLLNNTSLEFTLQRAFNYDGTSFNTQINARGLAFVNSYFWVAIWAQGVNDVYQYDSQGNLLNSFTSGLGDLRDIASNGTYLWLLDAATETVRRYLTTGVPDGWSFSISQVTNPYAVDFDGEYFWVLGSSSVYKYDSSGSYTGFSFSLDRLSGVSYGDIVSFNGNIWILTDIYSESKGRGVFRYKTDGTYDDWYFDIAPPTTDGHGLAHNGTYFWVITPGGTVYRYRLNEECLEFMEECDEFITFLPYTIDKSDTRYCLLYDLYIADQTAITFVGGVQNSSLDCINYNLDGNDDSNTDGVYLAGAMYNNVKNCVITDFENGILLGNNPSFNNITNNTVNDNDQGMIIRGDYIIIKNNTVNNNEYRGIQLRDNRNCLVTYNTIKNNGEMGFLIVNYGNIDQNHIVSDNIIKDNGHIHTPKGSNIHICHNAKNNTITRNIITGGNYGIYLHAGVEPSPIYNIFANSSVKDSTRADYYLQDDTLSNEFINMNWTESRTIYFYNSTPWFTYNNRTDIDLWLKTKVSSAATTLTRELISWNNAIIQWNDSSDSVTTATYNITGLLPYTYYYVYNNSVFTYTINSGSAGEISFTIDLPLNEEHEIIVNRSRQVLYFDFNEAKGIIAYDKSDYGNNGTFYGETFNDGTLGDGSCSPGSGTCPDRISGGYFGKALDFDGENDYVEVPTSDSLNPDYITVGAWIYPITDKLLVEAGGMILKKIVWDDKQGYFFQWINNSKTVAFNIGNGTHWRTVTGSTNSVPVGQWTYVAGTFDGSYMRVYINGVLNSSLSHFGTIAPCGTGLRIGAESYMYRKFNGTIDEVRIWNRALAEQEIQEEMQSSLPIFYKNNTKNTIRPVASYSFEEEDSANYVNDTHVWVKGMYDSALSFDRINDYVEVSDSETLKIDTGELTVETWINPGNVYEYRAIIVAKYGQPRWSLHYDGEGWDPEFGFYLNNVRILRYRVGIQWGSWYHVAATFSDTDDTAILYVNGTQVDINTNVIDSLPLDGTVNVGRGFVWGSTYYRVNGTIDEVRIYDKVLTQQEIQDDMNNL